MKTYSAWMLGGLAAAAGIAACSSDVTITAEKTSVVSSGSSMNATGSGASGPGGTGGSMGSGTGGSTGTGASGPGKIVTADNDIGQYQSVTILGIGPGQKVVDGPFFVTDVYCGNTNNSTMILDTIPSGDCSAPQAQHTAVLVALGSSVGNGTPQVHGIRLPVLAGQTLCGTVGSSSCTVLGFKPY